MMPNVYHSVNLGRLGIEFLRAMASHKHGPERRQ
jgi:hypothetical protein